MKQASISSFFGKQPAGEASKSKPSNQKSITNFFGKKHSAGTATDGAVDKTKPASSGDAEPKPAPPAAVADRSKAKAPASAKPRAKEQSDQNKAPAVEAQAGKRLRKLKKAEPATEAAAEDKDVQDLEDGDVADGKEETAAAAAAAGGEGQGGLPSAKDEQMEDAEAAPTTTTTATAATKAAAAAQIDTAAAKGVKGGAREASAGKGEGGKQDEGEDSDGEQAVRPWKKLKTGAGKEGGRPTLSPAGKKKQATITSKGGKAALGKAIAPPPGPKGDDLEGDLDDELEDELEDDLEDYLGSEGEDEGAVKKEVKVEKKKGNVGKQKVAKGKAAAVSKVEGVGLGAMAAALKHSTFDLSKIVTWKSGSPTPYTFLADTFEEVAVISKRLDIIHLLTSFFRAVIATSPQDLLPAVYLCTNRVAPAHSGIELGVGEAILIKALAQATGRKESVIKREYGESGDLGTVAVASRSTQRVMMQPAPLTVAGVYKTFRDIASAGGTAAVNRKMSLINKLLVAAKGNEAGYIMRSLQGKLRIGLAEQSVLVALAHATLLQREGGAEVKGCSGDKLADRLEQGAQVVKQVYSECPSYDQLVPALLAHGVDALPTHCHFQPGVPIKPMLAKPTTGVGEVLEKFKDQPFTCEYKYDGERAQVHVLEDGSVQVYSRNSENNTVKYPDVVQRIKGHLGTGTRSIVFDSEIVAWDVENKRIMPFQVLSTRARKDVAVGDIKVHVVVYAFDCLYLNGKPLLTEPLTARRQALYGALVEVPGQLQFALAKNSRDVEELETFLNESVEAGTEGLIVKTMDDTYEPARRSSHWLKLKKDYMDGVGDTFDVVPLGAWYGKGKRTGVFGAYLLGVYNPETEGYQTISKLGTGFSEQRLVELADSLRPHIIPQPRPYYQYGETLLPDVWFDPVVVWEVKAADLSVSPVHQAGRGLVDPDKGISIRFPRLIRVRDDKGCEDATSAEQVAEMYRRQAIVQAQQKKGAVANEAEEEEDL